MKYFLFTDGKSLLNKVFTFSECIMTRKGLSLRYTDELNASYLIAPEALINCSLEGKVTAMLHLPASFIIHDVRKQCVVNGTTYPTDLYIEPIGDLALPTNLIYYNRPCLCSN